ncbi:tripartite tricarboxylate transporter permease [Pelagibacterium sp.]|uniref:tripartite tricarboxylate transporter permease n=1 Tax=Pelagibacterium sp. TaxID=1967288 RepID=UPI003A8E6354
MVDVFSPGIIEGFYRAVALDNILYCLVGVTLGMVVGVIPGIGTLAAISLLIPLTFYLEPLTAISLLAGIYYGSAYGGSTASILLNLPGTASSAVTCLDGYPMTKKGRAGPALFITAIASFVGAIFGTLVLAVSAEPFARLALQFRAQEYFSLMVLGLIAATMMTSAGAAKSLVMVALGLLIGMVGIDGTSGTTRFAFGVIELYDGVSLVAIALGLFGLSELMRNVGHMPTSVSTVDFRFKALLPNRKDWREMWPAIARGSGLGSLLGTLPGTGSIAASFLSYALERKTSRTPEKFGKGAIEGIAGPESANNAAIQTAFIPTFTLGIPGDPVVALLLGVLIIHGVTPGPQFIVAESAMFWGVIFTFIVGNIALLIMNIPLIGVWVRLLAIPYSFLFPSIVAFICVGAYSVSYSIVDLYILILFGVVGYFAAVLKYPVAPLLLGFILGPMMEQNFQRAMLLQRGNILGFFERPLSAIFLLLALVMLILPLVSSLNARKRNRAVLGARE